LALLGLAATAIPALLHLLERRVPPEAEFPPMRYLSEAERQSARRLKLRHLLLLVLRTALIALIVMAAARPLVRSRGPVGGEAHEPTGLALILDNSPSSGAVVDGRPLIERLKSVAHAVFARAAAGANRGVARGRAADGALAIAVAGTPGGSAAPVTVRLRPAGSPAGRNRDVGRALAAPGSSASVPLPSVAPGWWIGEAVLDPD